MSEGNRREKHAVAARGRAARMNLSPSRFRAKRCLESSTRDHFDRRVWVLMSEYGLTYLAACARVCRDDPNLAVAIADHRTTTAPTTRPDDELSTR